MLLFVSPLQTDCFNYIKILLRMNSTHLYVCGTYAFSPTCAYIVSVFILYVSSEKRAVVFPSCIWGSGRCWAFLRCPYFIRFYRKIGPEEIWFILAPFLSARLAVGPGRDTIYCACALFYYLLRRGGKWMKIFNVCNQIIKESTRLRDPFPCESVETF